MSVETITLIPARGGSKRIPGKNMVLLGGKPLIQYSIETAQKLGYAIYVSSDSDKILDFANNFDNVYIIKRPAKFSSDISPDIEWMRHALLHIGGKEKKKIVFLRPTTPFRDFQLLKKAINEFSDCYTSIRSIELMSEPVEKLLRVSRNEINLAAIPKDKGDITYKANGYIDIVRPFFILKQDSIYGYRQQPFVTPRVPELDTPEDLEYAEYWGKKYEYI